MKKKIIAINYYTGTDVLGCKKKGGGVNKLW